MMNNYQSVFECSIRNIISEKINLAVALGYAIVCLHYSHSRLILHKRARSLAYRYPPLAAYRAGPAADLNLVKEGSDLKKERTGRKSSFPLGLLTSGNLSPVDSVVSRGHTGIYVGWCDRPIWLSGCYTFLRFVAVGYLTEFKGFLWLGISTSRKNSNRSRIFTRMELFIDTPDFSSLHARHMSHRSKPGMHQLVASANSALSITVWFFFDRNPWKRGMMKFRWYKHQNSKSNRQNQIKK